MNRKTKASIINIMNTGVQSKRKRRTDALFVAKRPITVDIMAIARLFRTKSLFFDLT